MDEWMWTGWVMTKVGCEQGCGQEGHGQELYVWTSGGCVGRAECTPPGTQPKRTVRIQRECIFVNTDFRQAFRIRN